MKINQIILPVNLVVNFNGQNQNNQSGRPSNFNKPNALPNNNNNNPRSSNRNDQRNRNVNNTELVENEMVHVEADVHINSEN